MNCNMLNSNGVHWFVHELYLIILYKTKYKNHKEDIYIYIYMGWI